MQLQACVRAVCLALAGMVVTSAALAQEGGNLSQRQQAASQERTELRQRLERLQKDIDGREQDRRAAAEQLRASEQTISTVSRRLHELREQQDAVRAELTRLESETGQLIQARQIAQQALAAQLRSQYASQMSPWVAALSGDDPQQIGRHLGYMEYLASARADNVAVLQSTLDRLQAVQVETTGKQQELVALEQETLQQQETLQTQRRERASVVARIEGQLQAQRAEAGRLGQDEARLGRVIRDLDTLLKEQAEAARRAEATRRAEAARRAAEEARRAETARRAAEAERQAETVRRAQAAQEQARAERERLAQEEARGQAAAQASSAERAEARRQAALAQAERERVEREQARQVAPARADDAAGRQAEVAAGQAEPEQPTAVPERSASSARFATLRGRLPWPVRGQVQGRFGMPRPDGGVWRGVLLRAAEGTPIAAVAAGTVVYANWLRGFGNLIIVDHGEQYLSVYAYNQSLLRQVGDQVRTGDRIAEAGATGGLADSGLYFEIRHQGNPVDPVPWLAR